VSRTAFAAIPVTTSRGKLAVVVHELDSPTSAPSASHTTSPSRE
jgi:hypothetical protein